MKEKLRSFGSLAFGLLFVIIALCASKEAAAASDAGVKASKVAPADAGAAMLMPELELTEPVTGASLTFPHGCRLGALTPAPFCEVLQRLMAAESKRKEDSGIRAIVEVDDAEGSSRERYVWVTLIPFPAADVGVESRARQMRTALHDPTSEADVRFGAAPFRRFTVRSTEGPMIVFLSMAEGPNALIVKFEATEAWKTERLEKVASDAMMTLSAPALTQAPATPLKKAESAAASFLVAIVCSVVLLGPFALIGLRIFIRHKMNEGRRAREHAAEWVDNHVGDPCVACHNDIVFAGDALTCLTCRGIVHRACTTEHQLAHARAAAAHAQPTTTYR